MFENFSENGIKGDLSNNTTDNPPLFSLVNTFKVNSCTIKNFFVSAEEVSIELLRVTVWLIFLTFLINTYIDEHKISFKITCSVPSLCLGVYSTHLFSSSVFLIYTTHKVFRQMHSKCAGCFCTAVSS
jgi:hypothetical protein